MPTQDSGIWLPHCPCPHYLKSWACPAAVTGVGSLAKLIASDKGLTSLIMAVLTGRLGTQVLLKPILPKHVPGSSLLAVPSYTGFSVKTLFTKSVVHYHSFTIHLPALFLALCLVLVQGELHRLKDTTLSISCFIFKNLEIFYLKKKLISQLKKKTHQG